MTAYFARKFRRALPLPRQFHVSRSFTCYVYKNCVCKADDGDEIAFAGNDVQVTLPRASVRHAMVKRAAGLESGVYVAARSWCERRNTFGVRSPTIDANGLRSIMARIQADARGDAGLHHSLRHHDPCCAIRLGIPISTVFQSYSYCGEIGRAHV